jgi:hypothetical protein
MSTTANTQLSSALTTQSGGGQIAPQTLVSCVKLLKDSIVIIVKITSYLMDGMEVFKSDRDCFDTLSRITTGLTALMMYLYTNLGNFQQHY